jgi:hypothetical protein
MKNIVKNLIGTTTELPCGDFLYTKFSLPARLRGEYPWLSGTGATPADARNRANGRPCTQPEPPIRPNTASFRRRADGTYPTR